METLKETNLRTIYNFVLYVIKISPYKDYDFINKVIYYVYESRLIETRHPFIIDTFIVRNNTPYLRTLERLRTNEDLPNYKVIDEFRSNVTLVNNELIIYAEPDLDYISEYDRNEVDKLLKLDLIVNHLRSENSAPLINTDKTELYPMDVIQMYVDNLISDIACTYMLTEDQYKF